MQLPGPASINCGVELSCRWFKPLTHWPGLCCRVRQKDFKFDTTKEAAKKYDELMAAKEVVDLGGTDLWLMWVVLN